MDSRRKRNLSIVCWAFSVLAIHYSFMALVVSFAPPTWAEHAISPLRVAEAIAMVYAWLALLVMNVAWIYDHKLHKFWPISGTAIAGVIVIKWVALAPGILIYVASTLCLAIYLVYYHLSDYSKSADV